MKNLLNLLIVNSNNGKVNFQFDAVKNKLLKLEKVLKIMNLKVVKNSCSNNNEQIFKENHQKEVQLLYKPNKNRLDKDFLKMIWKKMF